MLSKGLLLKGKALAAILLAFTAAFWMSCKPKPKKSPITFTPKFKKSEVKKPSKKSPFPENFSYNPRGLRDPFEKPGEGNFTFGKVLAVLRGEGRELLVLMDIPGRGMRVVKKGDKVGDVEIVGIRKGALVVKRVKVMPWGEKKVYKEEIPLPGGER